MYVCLAAAQGQGHLLTLTEPPQTAPIAGSKKRKHGDMDPTPASVNEPLADDSKGSKMMKLMGWKYELLLLLDAAQRLSARDCSHCSLLSLAGRVRV